MSSTTTLIYLVCFVVVIGHCFAEEESKRANWAPGAGRTLEGDSEEELFELEKKPSWVVGRERAERSIKKRIIEFKKDLEQELALLNKYEDELNSLNVLLPLMHQKLREKRPSNGAGTRSVSKY